MMWRKHLAPDGIDEYVHAHADVWPEVLAEIKANGVTNFSIFIDGEEVFGYFEYDEEVRGREAPSAVMERWESEMRKLAAAGDASSPEPREIFHLD